MIRFCLSQIIKYTYLGEDMDSSSWTVLRLNETVGSVKWVSGTARGTDF